MTHRPRSHEIGALAVSAVSHEWIKRGGAVDEIKNDYGEDLLVQTSHDGHMDDSRIWVQVKGRESIKVSTSGKVPAVRISRDHASRWINAADLTVVVLWDVSANAGWYCLPSACFNPYDLLVSQTSHVSLRFRTKDTFDEDAVGLLTWIARINHASAAICQARTTEELMERLGMPDSAQAARRTRTAATFGLLMKLGLFPSDARPPKEFDAMVSNAYSNFRLNEYAKDYPNQAAQFNGALSLALLGYVESIQPSDGRGLLTFDLVGELTDGLTYLYEQNFKSPEDWFATGWEQLATGRPPRPIN